MAFIRHLRKRFFDLCLCLPKGTYAVIHTSEESAVPSTQQPTYEDVDVNGSKKQHAYINVRTMCTAAVLVIIVQCISRVPKNNSKTGQAQEHVDVSVRLQNKTISSF